MKKLGIIGGLGPMATAYFFHLIVEMTDAKTDQEHIEILIHNCPQIPDRTRYILGKSDENPLEMMISVGKQLKSAGVDYIAMPCVTAHYFGDVLEREIGVSMIHAVEETARYLQERKIQNVGIMATDATVQMDIFGRCMSDYGIKCLYPEQENQEKVMHLIYDNVKAGMPIEQDLFDDVAKSLFDAGAQVIILGCTELSMIKRANMVGAGILDVTEVLAKSCVEQCGNLKKEYKELITKFPDRI